MCSHFHASDNLQALTVAAEYRVIDYGDYHKRELYGIAESPANWDNRGTIQDSTRGTVQDSAPPARSHFPPSKHNCYKSKRNRRQRCPTTTYLSRAPDIPNPPRAVEEAARMELSRNQPSAYVSGTPPVCMPRGTPRHKHRTTASHRAFAADVKYWARHARMVDLLSLTLSLLLLSVLMMVATQ